MREALSQRLSDGWTWLSRRPGFTPYQLTLFFAAAFLILFLRQVGSLLSPQICCEDGNFYSQAYNLGWTHVLLLPNAGYLDIEPRLVASFALLFPLRWAPLVVSLFGFAVQILPSLYLLSKRTVTWGPLPIRALMAVMYVLMTNSSAVHILSLNSPWHLAVLAPLIAFSAEPETSLQFATDMLLLLLAALSGPYSVILLPVLLYYAWTQRSRLVWVRVAVVAFGAIAQIVTLHRHPRPTETMLGASIGTFARILGGNVFLTTIFGGRIPFASRLPMLLIVLAFFMGAFILYVGNKVAPRAVRLFTIYAFLMLGASLYKPLPTAPEPAWHFWVRAHGERYYFIPAVAFTFSLLWAVFGERVEGAGRMIAKATLCLLPLGIAVDFVHPKLIGVDFPRYAAQFEAAPKGESVDIPIYPGQGWHMLLKKH